MAKAGMTIRVTEMPHAIAGLRRAMSQTLRKLAEAEAHPLGEKALRDAADLFETGIRPEDVPDDD